MLEKTISLTGGLSSEALKPFLFMCVAGVLINAVLMILNLLPVPPMDGSRIVSAVLPPKWSYNYNQVERFGLLILMVLLATGILGKILGPLIYGFPSLVSQIFEI